MELQNNPFIEPVRQNGLNEFKVLTDRINEIDKTLDNYKDTFVTDNATVNESLTVNGETNLNTLNVENGGNINATNITVSETIKNPTLASTEPVESELVVGYDLNGNLIPVHAVYDTGTPTYVPRSSSFLGSDSLGRFTSVMLYDYIIDSQDKFNTIVSSARESSGLTDYKNIALIGGYGNGLNGEYLLTVDSDTNDGQFNNAKITCVNNAKININFDSVNGSNKRVFQDIDIDGITVAVKGTLVNDSNVILFKDSKIKNSLINTSTSTPAFSLNGCKLENVQNKVYVDFLGCEIKDCDTIQSSFFACNGGKLYVSSNGGINKKYVFEDCGLHLDVRANKDGTLKNVSIDVASVETSAIKCLDEYSELKKLSINVYDCDEYSTFIGNNNNPNQVSYKPYNANKLDHYDANNVNVNPENISDAYIAIGDTSKTPVYLNTDDDYYYLHPDFDSNDKLHYVATGDGDYAYVKKSDLTPPFTMFWDLEFKFIADFEYEGLYSSIRSIKYTSNKADKYIYNDSPVKTYIDMGETTGTILYSKNNGTDVYLDAECSADLKVTKYKDDDDDIGYQYGEFWLDRLYPDLTFSEYRLPVEPLVSEPFNLLEVELKNQDEYAVQITAINGNYINVKNAYLTQVLG